MWPFGSSYPECKLVDLSDEYDFIIAGESFSNPLSNLIKRGTLFSQEAVPQAASLPIASARTSNHGSY
ncbi:hypothetical protein EW146_g10207 [Bondarzewia mesenterica]|uniref:Uncharacterized protein n=1 Tax=Bondarzewia mesenterica TaxID=1095465 RepID=A0A4S4KZF0_9AGAM|nr:hypothetical protein EW146_g10207 [Bondarzewia mesenterica]